MKHEEIYNILTHDKKGKRKDIYFLTWCRRVYAIREAHGNATKHAEASDEQERQQYKILGEAMLRQELLPHQRNNPGYRIRRNKEGDVVLSSKQRSWIGNMLRKQLGDKKIALFIFQRRTGEARSVAQCHEPSRLVKSKQV